MTPITNIKAWIAIAFVIILIILTSQTVIDLDRYNILSDTTTLNNLYVQKIDFNDLDSVSDDLEIVGDLKYNIVHIFMNKNDTTVTPNCTGTGIYTKVLPRYRTAFDILRNNGFGFAGDSITIQTVGDYFSVFNFTMSGGNGVDYSVAYFKNGSRVYHARVTTLGATDYSGTTLTYCFFDCSVGDRISIWVANLTAPGTGDPTFTNIDWYVRKEPYIF